MLRRLSSGFLIALTSVVSAGVSPGVVAAQSPEFDPETASNIYYTRGERTVLYHVGDTTRSYIYLKRREPVHFLPDEDPEWDGWRRIRTFDGANGLVREEDLTNVWLRISKTTQTLFAYRGAHLIARIPTDLGYNFFADKVQRGSSGNPDHWRTPEGEFFVVSKNAGSQFYKAFVLNYPNAQDAARGLEMGLITEEEHSMIVQAERRFDMPPMNTELGGWIEIHGDGTGKRQNWTQGCVAIQNVQMDRLWDLVDVGTPVLITP